MTKGNRPAVQAFFNWLIEQGYDVTISRSNGESFDENVEVDDLLNEYFRENAKGKSR